MQLRDRPVLHPSQQARLGVAAALVLTGLSLVALSGRVSLPSLLEQGWQSLRPATVPARIAPSRPTPPRPPRHEAVAATAGPPRGSLPFARPLAVQPEAPRAAASPPERTSVSTAAVTHGAVPAPTPAPPPPPQVPAAAPAPAPAAPTAPPVVESPAAATTTATTAVPTAPVVVPALTTPAATTPAVTVPTVDLPALP